jgi:phosphoesterase RecJ-like protein
MKAHHPQILDKIIEQIKDSRRLCVVGHIRPDGDCIGSQLAVTLALRALGKNVVCWNQDPVPDKYAFLDPDKLVQTPRRGQQFDTVIATDCASYERLGKTGKAITQRKLLINIDHHLSNTKYGDLNWISAREASSGELVYHLLKVAGWKITPQIADCLFTAVSTDTGSFQYATTKPVTYHTAGELVALGANLELICDEVYQSYPLSRVRLLQTVYNKFRLAHDNQIAYLWLKQKDFTRTGADRSETEGLIDHIRAIAPVIVAIVFEELEPNVTRISLRSKDPKINVNEIAAIFGGGGHSAAAGARIVGSTMSTQRRVVEAVKKALDAKR